MAGGGSCSISSRASRPVAARLTAKPSRSRMKRRMYAICPSSSTTRAEGLPAAAESLGRMRASICSQMSAETPREAALVVEDDDQIAYLIQYILEQDGYEVFRAPTLAAADDLIDSMSAPAVATLDIALPDGSGVDLIIRIKSREGWSRVPILMITATPKDESVNWAIKSGAKAYIVKPFKPDALRDAVRKVTKKA